MVIRKHPKTKSRYMRMLLILLSNVFLVFVRASNECFQGTFPKILRSTDDNGAISVFSTIANSEAI